MRIWHQSFTVLDDVPHYRDALHRHLSAVARPGTEVDLHGMAPGTYPSDYPGTHIGYGYLSGLHKEQFVQAGLQAADEGYDAFFIATIPDTGFEEVRSLVDIPVVALGHTSLSFASEFGDKVGIVNFIAALEPQLRRNFGHYGFADLVGPIVQVDAEFTDVMGAYANPQPLLEAFTAAARQAIAAGANVLVPGEGPLNVFLADQGVTRVDEVPVIDSLGSCLSMAELRAQQARRSGIRASGAGFHHARPAREMVDAVRSFYGIPDKLQQAQASPAQTSPERS